MYKEKAGKCHHKFLGGIKLSTGIYERERDRHTLEQHPAMSAVMETMDAIQPFLSPY